MDVEIVRTSGGRWYAVEAGAERHPTSALEFDGGTIDHPILGCPVPRPIRFFQRKRDLVAAIAAIKTHVSA